MQEMHHDKYMAEIEVHAGIIIRICKDYGKEVGEALAGESGEDSCNIAREDAEKTMLLGVMRYILDEYIGGKE